MNFLAKFALVESLFGKNIQQGVS